MGAGEKTSRVVEHQVLHGARTHTSVQTTSFISDVNFCFINNRSNLILTELIQIILILNLGWTLDGPLYLGGQTAI